MKKILALALTAVLFAVAFSGCAKKSDTLNLYTWEGMFPQAVLDDFTKQTGVKVNYVNFDSGETMLSKLSTAKGGEYDVVIVDDYILESVISQGLAQKLDKSKLGNIGNVNPAMTGVFYDPTDEYTVPYGAGLQTIVYNPEKIKLDIKSYEDLWNPELKDKIGMIANYRVVNGMALKTMGESYNVEDIATIEAAGEKLLGLAPNVRLIKDDNLQDDLLSGEIDCAIMYTSQVTMSMLANPNLKVVYPTEGLGFGAMPMFIPSKAPNADAAHAFINFILQPEISKQCFEHIGYYSTNKAADPLIDDAYKSFLTMPDNLDGAESIRTLGDTFEDAHLKAFSEFRSACGQ